ncbi:MAG TPA: hypothetical protein VGA89_00255 [Patescibacteria group bacterium]
MTHNAAQELLQEYIKSLSESWLIHSQRPASVRKQLNTIGASLTMLALELAGVNSGTRDTADTVLYIEQKTSFVNHLVNGIIRSLEDLAENTLPPIGEGVGRLVGGGLGGLGAGARDAFNNRK